MSDAPRNEKREKRFHEAFTIGVILKGLNALLEIVLGVGLLLPIADRISVLVLNLAQQELIEDPDDFFATHIEKYSHLLSPDSQFFGAMYLLSHGIVKAALVWGLLRDKLWSYPASMAVLVLFILYQLIRFMSTHSLALIFLTIFDLIVLYLIWHEYRRKTHPQAV